MLYNVEPVLGIRTGKRFKIKIQKVVEDFYPAILNSDK